MTNRKRSVIYKVPEALGEVDSCTVVSQLHKLPTPLLLLKPIPDHVSLVVCSCQFLLTQIRENKILISHNPLQKVGSLNV